MDLLHQNVVGSTKQTGGTSPAGHAVADTKAVVQTEVLANMYSVIVCVLVNAAIKTASCEQAGFS